MMANAQLLAPFWLSLAAFLLFGNLACASARRPMLPQTVRHQGATLFRTYDTDHDGTADTWEYQAPDGRIRALAFADADGRPGEPVHLDAISPQACPHFILALDGVPYEIVAELYAEGHFRMFHPPARVICCFPAMTDLALSDLFHTGPCRAYQALYYDRDTGRLSNANAAYLEATNSPWLAKMNYRCSFWWDVLVYLNPRLVFEHELKGITETFAGIETGEAAAYSVGTAGLGTRGGRAAIRRYLLELEAFCRHIVWSRRGRVKITLVADHGHNLVENRRISFRQALAADGYRQAKTLRDPRDVVPIAYGLVTYAAFYTQDPAGVARCLARLPEVEFAAYPQDRAVVVYSPGGEGRISKTEAGFRYDVQGRDPLHLGPILDRLRDQGRVSPDGAIDPQALFAATVNHVYPNPLERLWRAFHGLVGAPPDLVVNLADGTCYGSRFFSVMAGRIASTHGSLNRANSTTFAMTMLGDLPPAMRSSEVLPTLERLRERTGQAQTQTVRAARARP